MAAAETEGLTLVRANNTSGFRFVSYHAPRGMYRASINRNGEYLHPGSFHKPELGALRVARWLCDQATASSTQAVQARSGTMMAVKKALAATAAEGSTLLRASIGLSIHFYPRTEQHSSGAGVSNR